MRAANSLIGLFELDEWVTAEERNRSGRERLRRIREIYAGDSRALDQLHETPILPIGHIFETGRGTPRYRVYVGTAEYPYPPLSPLQRMALRILGK